MRPKLTLDRFKPLIEAVMGLQELDLTPQQMITVDRIIVLIDKLEAQLVTRIQS